MTPDLWQRGCERLASKLPEQQFNIWIRPLPPALVEGQGDDATRVSLRVSNRFKLDWIRSQYAGRIESVLSDLAGHPVSLDLQLAPREGAGARPGILAPAGAQGQVNQSTNGHAGVGTPANTPNARRQCPPPSRQKRSLARTG